MHKLRNFHDQGDAENARSSGMRRSHLLNACALMLVLASGSAHAICERNLTLLAADDAHQASISFGHINLMDSFLQPSGTLLASTIVPPTNFTATGANADSVLWTCALTDVPNLYFLVAVNGKDRVGGHFDMSPSAGPTRNVYATYFRYAGLRLTMSGFELNRMWQPIRVTSYKSDGTKAYIRLGDIPPLKAELLGIRKRLLIRRCRSVSTFQF